MEHLISDKKNLVNSLEIDGVVAGILGRTLLEEMRDIARRMSEYVENPQRIQLSKRFKKVVKVCDFCGLYGVRDFLGELVILTLKVEESTLMPKDVLVKYAKILYASINAFGTYLKSLESGCIFNPVVLRKAMDEVCLLTGKNTNGRFANVFPSVEFNHPKIGDRRVFSLDVKNEIQKILVSDDLLSQKDAFSRLSVHFSGSENFQYFHALEILFSSQLDLSSENLSNIWTEISKDLSWFSENINDESDDYLSIKFNPDFMSRVLRIMSEIFNTEVNLEQINLDHYRFIASKFWVPRQTKGDPLVYKQFFEATEKMEIFWAKESINGNLIRASKFAGKISLGSPNLKNSAFELLAKSLERSSAKLAESGSAPYEFWVAGAIALTMMKQLTVDEILQDDPAEVGLCNVIANVLMSDSYSLDDLPFSPSYLTTVKNNGMIAVFKESIKLINETRQIVESVEHKSKLHGTFGSPLHIRNTSGQEIAAKLRPLVGIFKLLHLSLASQSVKNIIEQALDEETWANVDAHVNFFMGLSALHLYVERARSGDIVDFDFLMRLQASCEDEENEEIENLDRVVVVESNITVGDKVYEKSSNQETTVFLESSDDHELLQVFLGESKALIEKSFQLILKCEAENFQISREDVVLIDRTFHTLKGSGLTLGFKNFSKIAEAFQFMLDRWLTQASIDQLCLNTELLGAVRSGLNNLNGWIGDINIDGFIKGDLSEVTKLICQAESLNYLESETTPLQKTITDEPNIVEANSEFSFELDSEEFSSLSELPTADELHANLIHAFEGGDNQDEIDENSGMLMILISEVQTGLGKLEKLISDLSNETPTQETIEEIARVVHGLKGALRTCGLKKAGALLHILEDDLSIVKIRDMTETRLSSYQYVFDLLFSVIENLQSATLSSQIQTEPSPSNISDNERIENFIPIVDASISEVSVQVPTPEETVDVAEESRALPATNLRVISESNFHKNSLVRIASHKHGTQATAEAVPISTMSLNLLSEHAGYAVVLQGRTSAEISVVLNNLGELSANINRMSELLEMLSSQAEIQISSTSLSYGSQAGFDRFEMDHYTALQELTRTLIENMQDVRAAESKLSSSIVGLDSTITQKEILSTQVQREIGQLTVVNFSSRESKFSSILRLAAIDAKKSIVKFSMFGDAEIPTMVMNRIAPAIDHLLRNAVAHGIEKKEDRLLKSKSISGNITMTIKSTPEKLTIDIVDDGAGIDKAKVLSKARELGIAHKTNYEDSEIFDMLFASGLSTAAAITQLAGRGVGLESVKSTLQEVGGEIFVESEVGRGTRFKLEVPMDIVALSVMPVYSNGYMSMVPSSLIDKIIPIEINEAIESSKSGFIIIDGIRVAYIRFGWLTSEFSPRPIKKRLQLLLCGLGTDNPTAIEVDDIDSGRKVLVRSLGKMISGISGLIAGTTLSDSSVCLIVNPIRMKRIGVDVLEKSSKASAKLIMVVDDSLTVRMATARFLRKHGFEVVEASDGLDALDCLRNLTPDLFILDVEMPRMGGFELLQTLRSDVKFKNTPVIMITSRTAQKHRDHAIALGVNGYMGKPFEDSELLSEMNLYLNNGIAKNHN